VRDSKGRFVKGTAPGPGRPSREHEESYTEALKSAVSPAQFAKAAGAILREALTGNVMAFEALAKRLLPNRVDVDVSGGMTLQDLFVEVQEEVQQFDRDVLHPKDRLHPKSHAANAGNGTDNDEPPTVQET